MPDKTNNNIQKRFPIQRGLRVCNVLEDGRFGGPQARVVAVAERLKKYNIDTHVVYSNYDSDKLSQKLLEKKISNSSINITGLSKKKKLLMKFFVFFFPEVLLLYSLFKKEKFDIIHVNGSHQIKGALAAKMAGIPLIWHLNDTRTPIPIKKTFTLLGKHCAKGFIVAGQRVYDYYIRETPLESKPWSEIHAPVDTVVFDPEYVDADTRLRECNSIKILIIANITSTKGVEYFIEMAGDLNKKYPNLHFFIGGAVHSSQKKYYENLKKLADSRGLSNLLFLGKLDNVAPVLKAADIFVFTSLEEASPTAVWEAMSLGKAIVSTDVGSVRQYIEDGTSGCIVPVKDQKALNEKVELLIKDAALREKLGLEARAVARRKLDLSIAVEKHALFYRRICGGHI